MTTIRERCLAILKEPDRYQFISNRADLNAQHRLKRLCVEIVKMVREEARLQKDNENRAIKADADQLLIKHYESAAAMMERLAAAILAIGADE